MLAAPIAQAGNDFVIYSPRVVQGQNEAEARGFYFQDGGASTDGEYAYNVSAAHTFTPWWKFEVYFLNAERQPGATPHLVGYEFENTFQLAAQGRFFVTPGILFSYEPSTVAGQPDSVEFGPLFERQDGRFTQRLNLIWERQVGGGAAGKPEFRAAYSLVYRYRAPLQPALEVYLRSSDHSYQLGPVLYGELYGSRGGELGYNFGAVFGANRHAPDVTWIARVEYEFF